MARKLYAKEIFGLTVQDVESCRVYKVKDPENETEGYMQYLRDLIRLAGERQQSQAIPAAELERKLCQIAQREASPSCSSNASYRTESVDEEADKALAFELEKKACSALLADGGCATHPVSLDFDTLNPPGEYKDILWFWRSLLLSVHAFRSQLRWWQEFRDFQTRMREKYCKSGTFHAYRDRIHRMQEEMSLPWSLTVHDDPSKQNRLEDWNEFRHLYYSKLGFIKLDEQPAAERLALAHRKLSEAEPRLRRSAFQEEVSLWPILDAMAEWENKRKQAEQQVEVAQQKLQIAQASHNNEAIKREDTIRQALKEFEEAEQALQDAAQTDQITMWREGFKLRGLQESMLRAKGELGGIRLDIRREEVFLKWIDEQYPQVAADCGYPAKGSLDCRRSSQSCRFSQKRGNAMQDISMENKPAKRQRHAAQARHATRVETRKVKSGRCHKMQLRSHSATLGANLQDHSKDFISPRRSQRLRQKHSLATGISMLT